MKTQFSTEFDKKVNEAVDYINTKVTDIPRVAVVLGSGLAYFGDKIEADQVVETSGIPHFPEPTVSGHQGKMIFGRVGDAKLIALKGRSHYYEGKPLEAVTFYVHLLKKLGVEILVLTNAAGGVNPNYTPGDFVLITGFMNFGQVAVYGETDDTNLLSAELQAKALAVSRKNNVDLARGVYCWTTGPSFETPAEVQTIRKLGGDLAGMSTLPEAIVANKVGLKVLGISLVTNQAAGISANPLTHEEVKETADKIKEPYYHFMKNVINAIN